MDPAQRYPSFAFMERAVRSRIPRFAADYMLGGIGVERCLARNREALDGVMLMPEFVRDVQPDRRCALFGREYASPFAVAPIGMGGLIWPRAAEYLAAAARAHDIPFILSTFATTTLERIREIAGDQAWFQLYVPNKQDVEAALIDRVAEAGYEVLVVTVDVPTHPMRERDIRNGLAVPPRIDLRTLIDVALKPTWALGTLRAGVPRFENILRYVEDTSEAGHAAKFLAELIEGHVNPKMLARIRDRWQGTLVVKGVLSVQDALHCKTIGADGIVVSNHGGRQLDAAPTAIEMLPVIKEALGDGMTVMADGGIRSGLDVARMIACGAEFVLCGRAFMFAMAAMGPNGAEHAVSLLEQQLRSVMAQIGCMDVASLPDHLHGRSPL